MNSFRQILEKGVVTAFVPVLLLAGCSKQDVETDVPPSMSLSSVSILASVQGGDYSFTYSVVDTDGGGAINCTSDVSWISGIVIDDETKSVAFSVAANRTENYRSGCLALSYSGPSGKADGSVTVVQSSDGPVSLTLGTGYILASEGESDYSFSWAVSNASVDGQLVCSSETDWIRGIDCSQSGSVSFHVSANETGEMRVGSVTAVYSYSGGSADASVTVVQGYPGENDNLGAYSDIVGVYEASGATFYTDYLTQENTWTMTVWPNGTQGVIIDGLVPYAAGYYPESRAYIATATLDSSGQLVVPTQWTGYTDDGGLFIGYTPCVKFVENDGYYVSGIAVSATFTRTGTDTWESDYGMFLVLFGSYGEFNSMRSYADVTTPTVTIRKISEL